MRVKTLVKGALAVCAGVGVLVSVSACSTTAPPESVVLQYNVGTAGGKKFKACIQPNTKGDMVVNDENVALTVEKRQWSITRKGGGGDSTDPIVSDTKPAKVEGESDTFGPKVKIWAKTEFYLNTDCGPKADDGRFTDAGSPVVKWWERTGKRFDADTPGGWRDMLLQTVVPAQLKALNMAGRAFPADAVNTGENGTWLQMEVLAQSTFMKELAASNGGADYFCGPQFERNADGSVATVTWDEAVLDPEAPNGVRYVERSGTCPPPRISIQDAELDNPAVETARTNNYIEQQNAKAAETKANSAAKVAAILKNSGPGAVELQRQQNQLLLEQERTRQVEKCASAPGCTVVLGGAAGVNVNTR